MLFLACKLRFLHICFLNNFTEVRTIDYAYYGVCSCVFMPATVVVTVQILGVPITPRSFLGHLRLFACALQGPSRQTLTCVLSF